MPPKSLDTLVDLHQRQLDRMRRQMRTLEEQRDKFTFAIQGLQDELERERTAAGDDISLSGYLASYAESNKGKQRMIEEARTRLLGQMHALQEKITEEFQRLKRYETIRKQLAEREAAAQQRKETIELDDLGIERYLRQQQFGDDL